MGQILSISNKHILAVEGSDIPTLKVSGVVGEDFSGSHLADTVVAYGKDSGEVRLVLDSFGGSAHAAFSFYDTIRVEGTKLHVDGRGIVASAASVIMAAAGRKRSRLYPNAEYLVHNASGEDTDAVERANVKMQNIYMDLTGMSRGEVKALMAKDKTMSAVDAKKLGFVGAIVDHMKLAAHADNTKTMADEKSTKRVFAVDRKTALAALIDGSIEIDVTAEDAALKTQLDSAVNDLKAERTKVADLEASAKTQPDAVRAAVDAKEKELKAAHELELKAVSDKLDAKDKEIEALKKTPAAEAVKATGTKGVVDADANTPLAERYPKLTAEKLGEAFNVTLAQKRAAKAKA